MEENISVVVRVRPLQVKEAKKGEASVVSAGTSLREIQVCCPFKILGYIELNVPMCHRMTFLDSYGATRSPVIRLQPILRKRYYAIRIL